MASAVSRGRFIMEMIGDNERQRDDPQQQADDGCVAEVEVGLGAVAGHLACQQHIEAEVGEDIEVSR